jgi:hypothetical protein
MIIPDPDILLFRIADPATIVNRLLISHKYMWGIRDPGLEIRDPEKT